MRSTLQLALLAARGVDEVLEAVHRDLAEDGRDRALDVLGEQRQPRGRRLGGVEQAAEDERLAEHRRGLGERQRRVLLEDAARPGERRVQAVAELVGEREDVAAARRSVEQHVRVHGRDRVGAERAAALAGPHRRVDPVLVEEAPGRVAAASAEKSSKDVEHDVARLVPLDPASSSRSTARCGRSRRAGRRPSRRALSAVPALREVVAAAHRLDERLDRLVAGLVGEVAARRSTSGSGAGGRRWPCRARAC